ncbi:hypothetical protein TIFTF001_007371 [Ficus carica]|uniref:Uncharacterized protein n=1 Tax=Ficus carica TaxID=3494 RepID=A0AA87ZL62_FICCA|nr:hypothetical protein TIFTF001_007371 [Ficus carica]
MIDIVVQAPILPPKLPWNAPMGDTTKINVDAAVLDKEGVVLAGSSIRIYDKFISQNAWL